MFEDDGWLVNDLVIPPLFGMSQKESYPANARLGSGVIPPNAIWGAHDCRFKARVWRLLGLAQWMQTRDSQAKHNGRYAYSLRQTRFVVLSPLDYEWHFSSALEPKRAIAHWCTPGHCTTDPVSFAATLPAARVICALGSGRVKARGAFMAWRF